MSRYPLTREGGGVGEGEEPKSYDGKTAWSSINNSILSGYIQRECTLK